MYLPVLLVEHELSCVFKLSGSDLKPRTVFFFFYFINYYIYGSIQRLLLFFLLSGGIWTKFWIGTVIIRRTPGTIIESKK